MLFLSRMARFALPLMAALVVAVSFFQGAAAADEPRFASMEVSIWPEYDQPNIFVNYSGELAETVTLPATLTFALPQGAQVNYTCEIDQNNQHTVVEKTLTTGDKPTVTYATGKKTTHVEFYYGPFEGAGTREFTHAFVAPGPVDSLVINVQQPLRATNFVVNPAPSRVIPGEQGFQYHQFEYSNVTAGQSLAFTVSYEKPDAQPSIQPGQEAAATNTATAGSEFALPLIFVGLGLVALAFFFYIRTRQRPRRRMVYATATAGGRQKGGSRPAYPKAGGRAELGASAPSTGASFCTKCGARLRSDAAFCSACGQHARRQV